MSFSEEPIIPTEPEPPQPQSPPPLRSRTVSVERGRRRRAARREMFPADAEGQAAFIAGLSRRAYPSFELFVFSLVCGAILGLGFLLDSQAVLLLGILITPLMTPWVGFLLAIITGSPRFLFETSMALLISAVIVFLAGLLTGFAARLFLPITLTNVFIHARLWVPALIVLSIGSITLVASFARSEDKPFLPSVIIAYAFYLPINAGGFGLGSGVPGIWPQGLLVFIVHFALAGFLGLLTLFAIKLRPTTQGVFFSVISVLLFLVIMVIFMGTGIPAPKAVVTTPTVTPTVQSTTPPSPTLNPTDTPTVAPSPESTSTINITETVAVAFTQAAKTLGPAPLTTTGTVVSPTVTPTLGVTVTNTLPATATNTQTVAQTPTPTLTREVQLISGTVSANEGGGANLRQTPNGKYLMTLDNGTLVEISPDFRSVNGVAWVHVFVTRNGQRVEGWLLESVLSYSTPQPNFEPSVTATVGVTPVP